MARVVPIIAFGVSLLLGLSGCEIKKDVSIDGANTSRTEQDYIDQPMSGLVGGKEWMFTTGIAEVDHRDQESIRIRLTNNEVENPCQGIHFANNLVMTSVPMAEGETRLGVTPSVRTATFYVQTSEGSFNAIAYEGKVMITSMIEGRVSGAMVIKSDEANFVNGTFDVPLCGAGL